MTHAALESNIKLWIPIIKEADASGLSATTWCEQNNISLKSFRLWRLRVYSYLAGKKASEISLGKSDVLPITESVSDFIAFELPPEDDAQTGFSQDEAHAGTDDASLDLEITKYHLHIGSTVPVDRIREIMEVLRDA